MSFFVAFPLRLLAHNKKIFDTCVSQKIPIEIGLDAQVLENLDTPYHHFLAGEFQKAGLTCAVHLPFFDLHPGSPDPLIRAASQKRLVQALEVAAIYTPVHLVARTGFQEYYSDCFSEWSSQAVDTWKTILSTWKEHPCIYFENVFSREPGVMHDFLAEMAMEKCRFCLDVGHWYSFARGANSKNLALWLQELIPFLGHLHLHDNCGMRDRHLGLGCGTVPWEELFSNLELMELEPSITLEHNTAKDLQESFSYMRDHFAWFSRLGVSKKHLDDLLSIDIVGSF